MKNLNRLNTNIALKILLLFGFAALFLHSIFTGSVTMYVHPRIIPYMIFAAIAMIIIALLLLRDLCKAEEKRKNSWPLLFFIIPLIMAFALPAETFDSSAGVIGKVQISNGASLSDSTNKAEQEPVETDNSLKSSSAIDTGNIDESEKDDENTPLQDVVLVMDSSNFYKCLCEIYADMDKYKGMRVEVVGFVFYENESFADNEFVSARLMMVCCAADMQPVGLLCQYEKTLELEANSWVKVNGTIEETQFDGETIPVIIVQSVEMTDEPDYAYVYPY